MKIGYFLSSEEFGPRDLVHQAKLAEAHGFQDLWVSDHYHPWNSTQGNSPFVWGVIGALAEATTSMTVTTGVTCPTMRIHPAIMAQAAATAAVQLEGRFIFGVGSGEALNEHIFGDPWPEADIRLEMLEESIALIRELWKGKQTSWDGNHFHVENAHLYTLPETPPEIYVSGFGPKAIELAARVGDGFCFVAPEQEVVQQYRDAGGQDKVVQGGAKVCWGADEATCLQTAHATWGNEGLPGELPQILPTPSHFEQAMSLVTEDMIAESVSCGPDMDKHVAQLQAYADAGFDEVYVQQIGGDHEGFFEAFERDVLPHFA